MSEHFQKGCCIECGEPGVNGFYCNKHAGEAQKKTSTSSAETTLSEMAIGQTGYPEPYCIHEECGAFFITTTGTITSQPQGFKFMKVLRTETHFWVDKEKLAPEDIWAGLPTGTDKADVQPAQLVYFEDDKK